VGNQVHLSRHPDAIRTDPPCYRLVSPRLQRIAAALSFLAAITATGAASAAVATTAPGQVYVVNVTLTDKGISLPAEKNRHGRTLIYQRGGAVQYRVVNRGTKPYVFFIGEQETPVIAPGHTATIQVQWYTRGNYSYERLYHGKPVAPIGAVHVT